MEKNNVVVFENITKKFGDIIANHEVNFAVEKNEVHALLGEKGAGKSTLMSILFGLYKPTKGNIHINGELVRIKTPRHANKLKIAMLPQHFKLVENMSVLENIMLGYEITTRGILNKKAAKEKIINAQNKYNIKLNLDAQVGKLSVSDKQKVELLKILWGEAEIIIFDEPTSILTPKEIEEFLKLITNLKNSGKTILLITHKLSEIKAISDRVSIIRKGKYIKTVFTKDVSKKDLANLMVGKEVDLNLSTIERKTVNKEIVVLDVSNISYKGVGFEKSLFNSSFQVKSGEILGIAAIEGNGQSELMKIISGIYKPLEGNISITEHDVTNKSIKDHYYTKEFYSNVDSILRIKKIHKKFLTNHDKNLSKISSFPKEKQIGITDEAIKDYSEMSYYWAKKTSLLSHIPEDRHEYGLILDYSVAKNVVLQDLKYFSNKFGILNKKAIELRLDYIKEKYDVRGIQNYKTKVF